ncbi:Wzz/FepE/Etk N-terminal domain-containing protein [Kluyvera ascorbata]|uniref:Wzz/FepE/Etk N-terminal domain-containing protein n=1 Tax=Kluyvera ascorbata TaxID=51288 RepID=UPI0039F5F843
MGRSYDPEQVDLIDLFIQLWKGKWIIVLSLFIALICAKGYLLSTKKTWISTAIVTLPDMGDVAQYSYASNLLSLPARTLDRTFSSINASSPYSSYVFFQRDLLQRFSAILAAAPQRLDKSEILTIEPLAKDTLYQLNITLKSSDNKNMSKVLDDYIQYANNQVKHNVVDEINISARQFELILKNEINSQIAVANQRYDSCKQKVAQALLMANEANIKTPQLHKATSVQDENLFLLGTDMLTLMQKHQSTCSITYPAKYYDLTSDLMVVQKFHPDVSVINSFKYILKPAGQSVIDKSKVVLTLAIIFGVVFGSGLVLIKNAVCSYRGVK